MLQMSIGLIYENLTVQNVFLKAFESDKQFLVQFQLS